MPPFWRHLFLIHMIQFAAALQSLISISDSCSVGCTRGDAGHVLGSGTGRCAFVDPWRPNLKRQFCAGHANATKTQWCAWSMPTVSSARGRAKSCGRATQEGWHRSDISKDRANRQELAFKPATIAAARGADISKTHARRRPNPRLSGCLSGRRPNPRRLSEQPVSIGYNARGARARASQWRFVPLSSHLLERWPSLSSWRSESRARKIRGQDPPHGPQTCLADRWWRLLCPGHVPYRPCWCPTLRQAYAPPPRRSLRPQRLRLRSSPMRRSLRPRRLRTLRSPRLRPNWSHFKPLSQPLLPM